MAQKSEKLIPVLPQVLATNPTLHDHQGPHDHFRCTVHHSFDPLGAGEMDLQVILGSFDHWQGGLWPRSLKNSYLFLPQVLATNPTLHNCHGPNNHVRTTVHHSLDPLGAGEMDLQAILGSFGHWQGGLWLRSLKNSPAFFAPSLNHKSNIP